MRRLVLITTLALLGGAAPAIATKAHQMEVRHSLTTAAAQSAIAKHEGKGTKVSLCKRRHPGIVCYFRTPVPRGQNEAVRDGWDRAVLRHHRVLVTRYREGATIECPNDCGGYNPPALNTVGQDRARSQLESQSQLSHEASPEPALKEEPMTPQEASDQEKCDAEGVAKNLGVWECAGPIAKTPKEPEETTTTVPAGAVVECVQSGALDNTELEEHEALLLQQIAAKEHKALASPTPGGSGHSLLEELAEASEEESYAIRIKEEASGEVLSPEELAAVKAEFDRKRAPIEARIAAVKKRAAEEGGNAYNESLLWEFTRIENRENACETTNFPPITVSLKGMPIKAANSWWKIEGRLETKAVEEGKLTAVAVGEATGHAPSHSAPVPVRAA